MLLSFNYFLRWYISVTDIGLSQGEYEPHFILSSIIGWIAMAVIRPIFRLSIRRVPFTDPT